MRAPTRFPWRLLLPTLLVLVGSCGESPSDPTSTPASQEDGRHPDDPPGAKRATHDHLRADVALERSPADGQGRAWLEAHDGAVPVATASTPGRWTIVYEAGPLGIAVDGYVRLTPPAWWDWSRPQVTNELAPGYCVVTTDAQGVELESVGGQRLDVIISGRALTAGERIRIDYGAGPAGARADRYAEADSRFWISVDGDGDGVPGILVDSPGIAVKAGPAALLRLTLPSTAHPGDTVLLRLAVLDRVGNRGVSFTGELQLESIASGLELPKSITFAPEDEGVRALEVRVIEDGVHRILAAAEEPLESGKPLVAVSNPLLAAKKNARILWADLHGHSSLSDGTGTPDEFLSYARDVAGLDAVCLTDHDHFGMLGLDQYPELFREIRYATERFHDPGTFVTILGYEWTSWLHGHRHVLFFEGEGKVLSSIDDRFETPAQLWDGLRGEKAMTFAHHSAGGPVPTNWDYPPDPEFEPVTEIVSVHGSSEAPDSPRPIYSPVRGNFVRDILDRGYQLGFVGSGDSHDGHPGFADIASGSGSGLAAILTEDLTRNGIHDALFARRCYATNGPRIILRTALSGHRMGDEVPAPIAGEALQLYVRVIPEVPLSHLDIVRGEQIWRQEFEEDLLGFENMLELVDLKAGEYVYVRAVQRDGGAAWSSPFFITE